MGLLAVMRTKTSEKTRVVGWAQRSNTRTARGSSRGLCRRSRRRTHVSGSARVSRALHRDFARLASWSGRCTRGAHAKSKLACSSWEHRRVCRVRRRSRRHRRRRERRRRALRSGLDRPRIAGAARPRRRRARRRGRRRRASGRHRRRRARGQRGAGWRGLSGRVRRQHLVPDNVDPRGGRDRRLRARLHGPAARGPPRRASSRDVESRARTSRARRTSRPRRSLRSGSSAPSWRLTARRRACSARASAPRATRFDMRAR